MDTDESLGPLLRLSIGSRDYMKKVIWQMLKGQDIISSDATSNKKPWWVPGKGQDQKSVIVNQLQRQKRAMRVNYQFQKCSSLSRSG